MIDITITNRARTSWFVPFCDFLDVLFLMTWFKFLFYENSFCNRRSRIRKFYKTDCSHISSILLTKNHGKLALLEKNGPIKIFLKRLTAKYV